jgi:hypothetical protein
VVYGVLAFVASLPGAGLLLVRWVVRQPVPLRQPEPLRQPVPLHQAVPLRQPVPNRSESA